MKRVTEHGNFCGSPKWTADSRHVIAYCMTAEQTLANRRPAPEPGNDTRLVSIDVDQRTASDLPAGPGVKINPSPLPGNDIGYVRKDTAGTGAGIYYTSGKTRTEGRRARGRMVTRRQRASSFHKRLTAPPTIWLTDVQPQPRLRADAHGRPAVVQPGGRPLRDDRPAARNDGVLGTGVAVAVAGADEIRRHLSGQGAQRSRRRSGRRAATRSSSASASSTRSSTGSTVSS